MRVGAG